MNPDQLEHWIELFMGHLNGTLSESEAAEFEELTRDPRFAALREKLEDPDSLARRMAEYGRFDDRRAFERFREAAGLGPRRSLRTRWTYVATGIAAAIAVVGGAFVLELSRPAPIDREQTFRIAETRYPAPDKVMLTLADGRRIALDETGEEQIDGVGRISYDSEGVRYEAEEQVAPEVAAYNELAVPEGSKCRITLDDGTEVWLNAGSTLRYPVKFSGKERRVELSGEGLFDVTHNPERPFIVEAGKTTMTVRGTKFNVRDFEQESMASTTLIEGCVEVANDAGQVTLRPGMQSRTHDAGELPVVREVDTSIYTAWTEDKIAFYDAGLEEVMAEISRWYRVRAQINVDPEAYALTGKIPRDFSLAAVIDLLESITDLEFGMPDEHTLVVNKRH